MQIIESQIVMIRNIALPCNKIEQIDLTTLCPILIQ